MFLCHAVLIWLTLAIFMLNRMGDVTVGQVVSVSLNMLCTLPLILCVQFNSGEHVSDNTGLFPMGHWQGDCILPLELVVYALRSSVHF